MDGRRRRLAIGAASLLIACVPFFDRQPILRALRDFEPAPRPRLSQVRLETGLVVQVPVANDSCWDAPLPCTPRPNPALRLRREGDLGSGFMVDQSAK